MARILYYLHLFFGVFNLVMAMMGHPLVVHLPLVALNFLAAAMLRKEK